MKITRIYLRDKSWDIVYKDCTFLDLDMISFCEKFWAKFLYATCITNDKETKDNQAWLIQETTEN